MPYYIFQVYDSTTLVKKLTLTDRFDQFKEAKSKVKTLRSNSSAEDDFKWKLIFADSQLQAEELLQEKREAPVLMEWEK